MTCCETTFLPVRCDVFVPIVTGDTYPESIVFEEDGIDQTLTRVTVDFKESPSQSAEDLQLDSATGGVTLNATGANAWNFTIPDFVVSLPAGSYFYHIRCFFTGGTRTLVQGEFQVSASI